MLWVDPENVDFSLDAVVEVDDMGPFRRPDMGRLLKGVRRRNPPPFPFPLPYLSFGASILAASSYHTSSSSS